MCPAAGENQKSICASCPKRQECIDPCEKLEKALPAADGARLPCHISKRKIDDLGVFLAAADRLDARSQAIVYLYYQCALPAARIAEAFEINRTSVHRILRKSWRILPKTCHITATSGETEIP